MKLFQSQALYNAKTNEWEEIFWIDGNIVDSDLYFFEMDKERELEIEKLTEEENEIDNECDCPECTLDRYTEIIQEITGGCPGCIREVLENFMMDIVDHIVIEDIEEETNQLN